MGELKIPDLVKKHGKVAPAWKEFDLQLLHRATRCGRSLEEVASLLPCLWYFQPALREPILRLYIENDDRIKRSIHENVGSGEVTYLEYEESDLIPTDKELTDFSNVFTALCDGLLSLPKRDCESLLDALAFAIKEVKTDNEIQARTLDFETRRLALALAYPPPPQRPRRPFQKSP